MKYYLTIGKLLTYLKRYRLAIKLLEKESYNIDAHFLIAENYFKLSVTENKSLYKTLCIQKYMDLYILKSIRNFGSRNLEGSFFVDENYLLKNSRVLYESLKDSDKKRVKTKINNYIKKYEQNLPDIRKHFDSIFLDKFYFPNESSLLLNENYRKILVDLKESSNNSIFEISTIKIWLEKYREYYFKIIETELYKRWLVHYFKNKQNYNLNYEYLEGIFVLYYENLLKIVEIKKNEVNVIDELKKYEIIKNDKTQIIEWVRSNLDFYDNNNLMNLEISNSNGVINFFSLVPNLDINLKEFEFEKIIPFEKLFTELYYTQSYFEEIE